MELFVNGLMKLIILIAINLFFSKWISDKFDISMYIVFTFLPLFTVVIMINYRFIDIVTKLLFK